MSSRFHALHPDPYKKGTNIDRGKYTQIKSAILSVIEAHGNVPFNDLPQAVEEALDSPFDGSISWYVTTVKLDLEARGLIERVPNVRPQLLRRTPSTE
jgi:hypothetical protein